MILQVLPLIHRLIRKRISPKADIYEDFVSAAVLRVITSGVDSYDPAKGAWTTWTAQWVRAAVGEFAAKEARRAKPCATDDLCSDGGELIHYRPIDVRSVDPETIAAGHELLARIVSAAKSRRDRNIIIERAYGDSLECIGRRCGRSHERMRQVIAGTLQRAKLDCI